ncbi:MAG: phosphopantothenoylcysteine decarboxylase [Phycisphaerae bacterium]|jgi:phosphopantothenoylcysteine decarboxylase/phosphopantothenate--cysteine ligase
MRRTPLRLLITAGPTREYLDPVRYLSNDSSGRMGFALAEAARRRGWRVTLVHGPVALAAPAGVRAIPVVSAADMLAACQDCWPRQDALIMAAAVADYAPAQAAPTKLKKSPRGRVLRLEPTVDILATLAADRRADQVVIGFALEDRAPRQRAVEKLRRKRLDAIVLNRPEAIGAQRTAVEILERGSGWQALPTAAKSRQAQAIIALLARLHDRQAARTH